ncbi:MAG: murein biosynthesis integral membrane protein MurJ [Thermoleophilia bacterium]|nr:murein biosynthesis integral membrane protein MurJ [Thermoleophilia bacterium]
MEERFPRRRLARSTAIVSLATALSRALGLVREMVTAYYFGVRGPINAFTVAFQIPNLVRIVISDAALSAAFVPVFSELLEKGDRRRAWRVASTVLWLLLLVLGGVTALFVLVAPLVVPAVIAEYDDLAVTLAQLLFPIVVLLGVSGIVVAILNSYDHFTVPALTPVAWNLVIIAGLVLGVPRVEATETKLYLYAAVIVLGTLVQVLLPFPWLRGRDDRLRVVVDWRDPAVRRVFVLMLPVTLSLGLINLNQVIGTFVAARWIDATIAPTAIDKAFRLYMLPQGMFSVAIATVLFPSLARLAARADVDGFRRTVGRGLRQIAFLLVPASVASAVLAEPIVRVIYERGEFEPDQTPVVAAALAAFSLGLTFNGAMLLLNRAFFGLQQARTPTLVAGANLVLNTALYGAFYRVGAWGVPLAISLANVAGAAALLWLLRRRIGSIELRETAAAVARIAVAAAGSGAVMYAIAVGVEASLGRGLVAQLATVAAALAAGAASYVALCRVLGVRELQALLSLRRRGG